MAEQDKTRDELHELFRQEIKRLRENKSPASTECVIHVAKPRIKGRVKIQGKLPPNGFDIKPCDDSASVFSVEGDEVVINTTKLSKIFNISWIRRALEGIYGAAFVPLKFATASIRVPLTGPTVMSMNMNVGETVGSTLGTDIFGCLSGFVDGGWKVMVKGAGIPFAIGFITGVLDDLVDHIFAGERWKNHKLWFKLSIASLLGLIGITFLALTIITGGVSLGALIVSLLIGAVLSLLGFGVGKFITSRLLKVLPKWITEKITLEYLIPPESEPIDELRLLVGTTERIDDEPTGEFFQVGVCMMCGVKTATVGWIHSEPNPEGRHVAHIGVCNDCTQKHQMQSLKKCICLAKGESMIYMEGYEAQQQGYLGVGLCTDCDENGHTAVCFKYDPIKTASTNSFTPTKCNKHAENGTWGRLFGYGSDLQV